MNNIIKLGILALGISGALAGSPPHGYAQDSGSVLGRPAASVTYGPYVRASFGAALSRTAEAYWLPPGPSDPRISFASSADETAFGAVAFGYDWQNGFRADVSILGTGTADAAGDCTRASDGTACSVHADVTDASVSTRAAFANVFFAPLEAGGSDSLFQPFVVLGLGVALNEVDEWTRENPASGRPQRTFAGNTSTSMAWSAGIGASLQITRPDSHPVLLEASWRYYDFGSASGGATPLAGSGTSEPRKPFSFDTSSNVIAVGVRIPLQRY